MKFLKAIGDGMLFGFAVVLLGILVHKLVTDTQTMLFWLAVATPVAVFMYLILWYFGRLNGKKSKNSLKPGPGDGRQVVQPPPADGCSPVA